MSDTIGMYNEISSDECWIEMVEICGRLQGGGRMREACESSLRLIEERLGYDRVAILLKNSLSDDAMPFYGFFGADQAIESEAFLTGTAIFGLDIGQQPSMVEENAEIHDFQGERIGLADRLHVPILSHAGRELGRLVVDNLHNNIPWTTASIGLFRLFSKFLSSMFLAKEAEVGRQRENLQMKALIDGLPAYIYIKDTESRFLLTNKKLRNELGATSSEEILGKTDFDYFPKDLAQEFYDDERRIMQAGVPLLNKEEESVNASGARSWVMTTKIPLKDECGKVFSLIGIGLDVTEQRRNQLQVVESEKCYRTLFNSISDAILVHDKKGRILDCNDRAQELFLHPKKELMEMAVEQLNLPDYGRLLRENRAAECNAQEIVQTQAGDDICVNIKVVPILYRDVEAYLALLQDVTEVTAAKKVAEDAAKAKSVFLANMSHEIRTPLNAVIGMTSLLVDGEISGEQREYIQTIQTSGDALLSLVNDILDLSKIDAGALRLEEVPFNLRHCIESALDIVAPKATEQGLELACSIDGEVPQVLVGDSARLRQVLLNLLNNAIKFTSSGEVVARVSGRPVGGDRHSLDFSVKDTGIGMTPEVAAKVLNPFEQADTSTTRKYGGTGLGLSICNKLIEMMGGSLQVKSRIGVGSEFSFSITLKRSEDEELAQTGINRNLVKGRRILVVDDNETNLKILEYQLSQWDAVPLVFKSGAEALDKLDGLGNIDLAVLDMLMPEMDGEMLATALRNRREFRDRPILILSSAGNSAICDNPVENAWLTKPVKPHQMLEKIALLLEGIEAGKLSVPGKPSPINGELGAMHPLRILVAEDNTVNQVVALRLLSRLGYEADLAQNGQEALDAIGEKTYDLVLMDIQMPVMDGIEATREILQRHPEGERPSIVAMTAHALQEFRQEGLESGMSDYITKPIKIDELSSSLEKIERRPD